MEIVELVTEVRIPNDRLHYVTFFETLMLPMLFVARLLSGLDFSETRKPSMRPGRVSWN
jgi:hypothetical protein